MISGGNAGIKVWAACRVVTEVEVLVVARPMLPFAEVVIPMTGWRIVSTMAGSTTGPNVVAASGMGTELVDVEVVRPWGSR